VTASAETSAAGRWQYRSTTKLVSQTATLHRPRALLPAIIGCQCDLFAARNTVPARALLACYRCLPETCCHLLPPPATSTAAACFAKTRSEVTRVWRPSWGGSEQSDFGRLGPSLEHEAALFHTWHKPLGVATKGAS
jgi:hypothetical protein